MGTVGAAIGQSLAAWSLALYALWRLIRGGWVGRFPRGGPYGPDWEIIRSLFRLGLPTGIQGIAMNIGGVLMLSFIGGLAQSAEAQAAEADWNRTAAQIKKAVDAALHNPELRQQFANTETTVLEISNDEFVKRLREQMPFWQDLVQKMDLKTQ